MSENIRIFAIGFGGRPWTALVGAEQRQSGGKGRRNRQAKVGGSYGCVEAKPRQSGKKGGGGTDKQSRRQLRLRGGGTTAWRTVEER